MNSVGIDVSKGKSTIAVMRHLGEIVLSPFDVSHTSGELSALTNQLKSLDGETRVVMETTGNYRLPIAMALHGAGIYVSVVNAMLIHNYGNNTLRKTKTDRKDAIKLANYGIDSWLKNNLISLIDTVFPDVNRPFSNPARVDGSEKWVDFIETF